MLPPTWSIPAPAVVAPVVVVEPVPVVVPVPVVEVPPVVLPPGAMFAVWAAAIVLKFARDREAFAAVLSQTC